MIKRKPLKMPKNKSDFALFIKNFIFGVEDSLVSTVGLLSGVAVAGLPKRDIFLAGVVLIFVEAFSMGVGSYLSEQSANEFLRKKSSLSIPSGIIMFVSYFVAGFIPLSPYLIFEVNIAFPLSITASLVSLFLLGVVGAKIFKTPALKQAMRMFLLGGMAIAVGVIVGAIVNA